jgi:hypothetical protein
MEKILIITGSLGIAGIVNKHVFLRAKNRRTFLVGMKNGVRILMWCVYILKIRRFNMANA